MKRRFVGAALAGCVAAVVASSSRPAHAYHDNETRLLDYTAHTLRAAEFRLGLWQFDAGLAKWLNVGTDTLPYVASFFLKRFIPNGHVRVSPLHTSRLTLSGEARLYYASAGGEDASGSLTIVPLSVFASTDMTRDLSLHFEGTYTFIAAAADARAQTLSGSAAVAVESLQLGTMLEYRLTRVTALTLRERYQAYFSPAVIHSSGDAGDAHVTVDANLLPRYRGGRLAVIAGVAFSWKNINLRLGAGYGSLFLPSLGLVLPGKSILPDGSFDVRF